MKLSELRTEVASELQYNPTATSYVDSVTRVINSVYEEICTSQRWHFLEKVTSIDIKAEVNDFADYSANLHSLAYDQADFPGDFIGCTLVGANDEEFVVVNQDRTLPQGVAYFQPDYTGGVANAVPTSLKYTAYLLPIDCDSVEGVVYRSEKLDVIEVSRSREKRLALDLNRTGLPQVFFEEDTKTVKGIDNDITVSSLVPSTGAWPTLGSYRWFYTLNQHGAESSPSNIVEASVSNATQAVILDGMEDTRHLWEGTGDQKPGISKTIYREFNGSGVFYPLVEPYIGDDITQFTDNGTPVDTTKPFEYTSGRRTLRLYPLSDKAGTLELRYKFRPQRLVRDADTPVLPPEFHRLLVYRTVAILASQHDGQALAAVHSRLASKMLKRMRRRYLGGNAATFRQRQYWNDVYKRVIQPDITWNG